MIFPVKLRKPQSKNRKKKPQITALFSKTQTHFRNISGDHSFWIFKVNCIR